MMGGARDSEFLKEHIRNVGVIMLAAMDKHFGQIAAFGDSARRNGGSDELRGGRR